MSDGSIRRLTIPELRGKPLFAVDAVIRRMLAKRPEDRYPDIAACNAIT